MYCHIQHYYIVISSLILIVVPFFLPHYLSPHHIFLPPLPCLHYPSASFILLCQRADLLGWAESLSAELFELQQPVSLWGKVEQARCGKMEQGRAVFTYWWMYRSECLQAYWKAVKDLRSAFVHIRTQLKDDSNFLFFKPWCAGCFSYLSMCFSMGLLLCKPNK